MGRTGKWFGYNHYQFQPDFVAMGKGLGNGYPVSALAISRGAADELEAKSLFITSSRTKMMPWPAGWPWRLSVS
jgi:acetylornithine aminotransferase